MKQFTFRQKHASGFIQRRLDYFFISNSLQDVITHADFFTALSTDHSPVTISIPKSKNRIHGHSFWKFSSSAKERRKNKTLLQNKLKELEGNLNAEDNIQSYNIYNIKKNRKFLWNTFQKSVFQKCKWNQKNVLFSFFNCSLRTNLFLNELTLKWLSVIFCGVCNLHFYTSENKVSSDRF